MTYSGREASVAIRAIRGHAVEVPYFKGVPAVHREYLNLPKMTAPWVAVFFLDFEDFCGKINIF